MIDNSSAHDARIDAVLEVYAHAKPAPGLEARVAARLSGARPQPRWRFGFAGASALSVVRRLAVGALAAAAGAAVVFGTIQHSEHTLPPQALRSGQAGGVSTADRIHTPTHAMPQGANIDPATPRVASHSRATVSRDQGRRATGTAAPRSPYPPEEQPSNSAKPQK